MTKQLLVLLAAIPATAYLWAKTRYPAKIYQITGASLGLVISPVGLALTNLSTIPIVGMLFGLFGAVLLIIHGLPGYLIAASVGLVTQGAVLSGTQQFYVELLNGFLWSAIYGLLGYFFDTRILRS